MENIKLYPTEYRLDSGLVPIRVKGVMCNIKTSKLVSQSSNMVREIYCTKGGNYWLHVMVSGLGHYVAVLTKEYADALIALNHMNLN